MEENVAAYLYFYEAHVRYGVHYSRSMSIKVNVVLIQCVSSYNQGGKSPVSLRNPRHL